MSGRERIKGKKCHYVNRLRGCNENVCTQSIAVGKLCFTGKLILMQYNEGLNGFIDVFGFVLGSLWEKRICGVAINIL